MGELDRARSATAASSAATGHSGRRRCVRQAREDRGRPLPGRSDIGLVERVHAEHGGRRRRRHLPAEELGADVERVLEPDPDHRMAGLVQRREGVVEARVAVEDQGDEHAVPAVDRRAAERLVHDGHDALAVLAEGFGQELLDPWAEGADRLGGHQGDLVPARAARARPAPRPAAPRDCLGRRRRHRSARPWPGSARPGP